MINCHKILRILICCGKFFTVKSIITSAIKHTHPKELYQVTAATVRVQLVYLSHSSRVLYLTFYSFWWRFVSSWLILNSGAFVRTPLFSAGNAYVTANWPHRIRLFLRGWFRRNIRCVILRNAWRNSLKIYLISGKKEKIRILFFNSIKTTLYVSTTDFTKRQVLIELCIFSLK